MSDKYYREPYKTQCRGFNTEFSVEDIRLRLKKGEELSEDEHKFINHITKLGLFP